MKKKTVTGFSKFSKRGKIKWIVENFFKDPEMVMRELMSYWHPNEEQQKILDGFSENTISNYHLPYGVSPNFVINEKAYCVPMVIEESSVVAAASSGAKFWMSRGGFKTSIIDTLKVGQVHFLWRKEKEILIDRFEEIKEKLLSDCGHLTKNMRERGGGIRRIELIDLTDKMPHYFQIKTSFETCDSMGANFINTIVESFGESLQSFLVNDVNIEAKEEDLEIIMCILSNYTPECVVKAEVSCPIEDLGQVAEGFTALEFAERFYHAIKIAHVDEYRATTHNKGIFNGIDAVVLATANDFRAIEACGHTYAARSGHYKSLSDCSIKDGIFHFWLEIPLAVGTVGGLTSLHPIAKRSLELMGNPNAQELMQIIAATGLAQNFAAIRSLVTTGIQKGHMRMHLNNILTKLGATEKEKKDAELYFQENTISYSTVRAFLQKSAPKVRTGGK